MVSNRLCGTDMNGQSMNINITKYFTIEFKTDNATEDTGFAIEVTLLRYLSNIITTSAAQAETTASRRALTTIEPSTPVSAVSSSTIGLTEATNHSSSLISTTSTPGITACGNLSDEKPYENCTSGSTTENINRGM